MGYKLPKSLRSLLRKPIGKLFTGEAASAAKDAKRHIENSDSRMTVSIGDYCTKTLINVNFFPDIVIYDNKTHRTEEIALNLTSYHEMNASNPPEWILKKTWDVIENAISFSTSHNCRVSVRINGEEDLLVIPTIISLPLESVVIYGQPPINSDEGIVVVLITPALINQMKSLLNQFEFHEEIINGSHHYRRKI